MSDRSLTTVQPLGAYLVEAGLITPAQIEVALNDQKIRSDMRLGEVLVARGWIKQQTLDYLIQKIIEPEQKAARHAVPPPPPPRPQMTHQRKMPLPSIDEDVTWVG